MSVSITSTDTFLIEEGDPLYPLKRSLGMLSSVLDGCEFESSKPHSIVILGASGNLASKKIYPTLWGLFRNCLLPKKTFIFGFGRTNLTVEQIEQRCENYIKVESADEQRYRKYWTMNFFVSGCYDNSDDFKSLNELLVQKEDGAPGNRIFYVALPLELIEKVSVNIKNNCMPVSEGTIRIILEKPFGKDMQSSDKISEHLRDLFSESQIYRIDHEIANEMVQNVITLRFSNIFLTSTWNRHYIASVLISYKEDVGVHGRGGYFDNCGIIRDVMQTHLMQILTLIAMEKPASCLPEDIRDEKLNVLKRITPMRLRNIITGQYVGNPKGTGEQRFGYLDDMTVPKNSVTPTYAITVLNIKNERWEGVPFILIGGKALNEQRTEVRIQYSSVPGDIFANQTRNEFVLTMKPTQDIYMKILMKSPGVSFVVEETSIDMSFPNNYSAPKVLDPYDRLMLDVICGTHMHCLRTDELHETWRIFTPILRQIEEDRIRPIPYLFGSQGPREAEHFLRDHNFV